MELRPFGDTAWRARLGRATDVARRRALLAALRSLPGVGDVVVSEEHVLVVPAESGGCSPEAVRDAIERTLDLPLPSQDPPREHVIAVRYDGPDLAAVAEATGLSVEGVVRLHASGSYVVSSMGFLPGFAYLRGLDAGLVLPRRPSPRARVAAGSVAVAGPYAGVYPFASPGGWHLLGAAVGFAAFGPAGATLALGDRVRFEVAS